MNPGTLMKVTDLKHFYLCQPLIKSTEEPLASYGCLLSLCFVF